MYTHVQSLGTNLKLTLGRHISALNLIANNPTLTSLIAAVRTVHHPTCSSFRLFSSLLRQRNLEARKMSSHSSKRASEVPHYGSAHASPPKKVQRQQLSSNSAPTSPASRPFKQSLLTPPQLPLNLPRCLHSQVSL